MKFEGIKINVKHGKGDKLQPLMPITIEQHQ